MFRNICSLLDFYCKGALHMKKILIVISAFLVFSSSFFGKNIMSAMAEEPDRAPQQKYYTSIRIEDGETLWSIADRYGKEAGIDTACYMEELKRMNGLSGDEILYAGRHLTVCYYSNEVK